MFERFSDWSMTTFLAITRWYRRHLGITRARLGPLVLGTVRCKPAPDRYQRIRCVGRSIAASLERGD
jgi:hypothetical protein